MIRNYFSTCFLSLLMLVGCSPAMDTELKPVLAAKAFQVDIPANFHPTEDLHDFAELQYSDETNGYYLIGILEEKSGMSGLQFNYSLPDYTWFVEKVLSESLDTSDVVHEAGININGLMAEAVHFKATKQTVNGPMPLWLRLCVVESPTHFYQLIAWTTANQQGVYAPVLDNITCSFQEIGKDPVDGESQPGGAESTQGS